MNTRKIVQSAFRLGFLCATAMAVSASAAVDAPPLPYSSGPWKPGAVQYGSMIVEDVPVVMDDGVLLRATVAFPTDLSTGRQADGTFPVVVEHTPYGSPDKPVYPKTLLTQYGFIYAVVRARGTGKSQGDLAFFSRRDGLDGLAIIDWAASKLAQSDGRVALVGCSYPGGTALTTLANVQRGSPVKAVIAACTGFASVQREVWLTGGMPNPGLAFATRGPDGMGGHAKTTAFFHRLRDEILAGGSVAYDGAFWRDRLAMKSAKRIVDTKIPILLWSGWKDINELSTLNTYAALQNAYAHRAIERPMRSGQPVSGRYQLVVGDWGHGGGLDDLVYLRWLETWVRGIDTGLRITAAPLQLFDAGADRWLGMRHYPLVPRYTVMILQEAGRMGEAFSPPGKDIIALPGLKTAPELIRFTSLPLASQIVLVGPVSLTLYAASSNANMRIAARLVDMAPDGTERDVSTGAILGSQRRINQQGHGPTATAWSSVPGSSCAVT